MTISRAYALEHFDEICERAENGEEIVLERPGRPGLSLVPRPAEPMRKKTADEAAAAIRQRLLEQKPFPGKIDYKALINEGRRF